MKDLVLKVRTVAKATTRFLRVVVWQNTVRQGNVLKYVPQVQHNYLSY